MPRYYTIQRTIWNLTHRTYTLEVMGKDGRFYTALASAQVPKLTSLAEAYTFLAEHAYKHYNLRDCYIEGLKGGRYPTILKKRT